MKIVCISDSHGAENTFDEIVFNNKNDTDLFLFLGDGYRDFEAVKERYPKVKLYGVSGNCDALCPLGQINEEIVCGKRIIYTHGHGFSVKLSLGGLKAYAKTVGANIAFYGHTHIASVIQEDGIFYINPGSVRDGRYAVVFINGGEIRCKLDRI
jgi:putative phosphoesterase